MLWRYNTEHGTYITESDLFFILSPLSWSRYQIRHKVRITRTPSYIIYASLGVDGRISWDVFCSHSLANLRVTLTNWIPWQPCAVTMNELRIHDITNCSLKGVHAIYWTYCYIKYAYSGIIRMTEIGQNQNIFFIKSTLKNE